MRAQGDIAINAGKDVNLISSNLIANEVIEVKAGNTVNLGALKEREKVTTSESKLTNTVKTRISNAWVEAGDEAVATGEYLKETSQRENAGSLEGEMNTAVSAAKAVVAGYKVAKLAQQAAQSAKSAASYGFYAEVGVTTEKEKSVSMTERARDAGSVLLGKDVSLEAGKDIYAKAAVIAADGGNLLLKAKEDIKIESGESTFDQTTGREKESVSYSRGTHGGSLVPDVRLERNASGTKALTQNNSQIMANQGTLRIESGKNTILSGANVKGKEVDFDVGGDVTLESKQDQMESHAEGYSLTLGQNIGFSISKSKSKENWTNSQSSIVGTDGVAIKAKELNMTGSTIANQKADGTDGGNLKIDVAHLNSQDLKDSSESSSYSFSIGTSLGKDNSGSTSWKGGSTHVSFSNGGHEKEGITQATIGQGEVVVGGDVNGAAGVNRDITQSQVVTKDEKTGGININITVDNETLSNAANAARGKTEDLKNQAQEIAKTIKDLPENLSVAGKRVGRSAVDMANAIGGVTDGVNPIKDYQRAIAFNQATMEFAEAHPELAEVLTNDGAKGTEPYKNALQNYADYVTEKLGIGFINVNLYVKEDNYKGKNDPASRDVFINIKNLDSVKSTDALETLGHEMGHKLDGESQTLADRVSDKTVNAWVTEASIHGYIMNDGADLNPKTYADALTLLFGNEKNYKLQKFDAYEKDVHFNLTEFLAIKSGFSKEQARVIANANQGTDDNPKTSPFRSVQTRKDFHFTSPERLGELRKNAFESGDPSQFGQYLHALQDSYSHQKDGKPYGHKSGHWTRAPDKTYLRPELANTMAEKTYQELNNFLDIKQIGPKQNPWENFKDQVQKFNREKKDNIEDKSKILE